jgi:hypothetical protein
MDEPWIVVKRFPYEEPYHTQVEVAASNGLFTGVLDFYCGVDELKEIGGALAGFPSRVPDEYRFEYGSEDPAKRFYRYFLLRAYTTDGAGHCALQFVMNLNGSEPNEGVSRFSISLEPAQIARLGGLFTRLHEHPSGSFRWTPRDDEFSPGSAGAA